MDDSGRRPPYCSVASLEEFIREVRTLGVPDVVDRRYLQRLRVARSNEWALLSALKFLGILDDRGRPTPQYRELQTSTWRTALRRLIQVAYAGLLAVGGDRKSQAELTDYFALTSSASQARNAARFFRGVLDLVGTESAQPSPGPPLFETSAPATEPPIPLSREETPVAASPSPAHGESLLRLKGEVLSWMPHEREGWTPEQYHQVLRLILDILENLDGLDDVRGLER
jgi:hypothetical protein